MSLPLETLNFTDSTDSTLILTPNERLSKYLANELLNSEASDAVLIDGNAIQSVNNWLSRNFEMLQFNFPENYGEKCLLTHHQEALLWKRIIRNHEQSEPLWFPESSVNLAIDANRLINLWDISNELFDKYHFQGADQSLFLSWRNEFLQSINDSNFITAPELYRMSVDAINNDLLDLPENILVYGFDEITPVQKLLFETLATKCRFKNLDLPDEKATARNIIQCENYLEEFERVAQWAFHANKTNPEQKIAIIIPSLSENHALIESIFTKYFCPQQLNLEHLEKIRPFNISSGIPLSQTAVVKSALIGLRLMEQASKGNPIEKSLVFDFINATHTNLEGEERHSALALLEILRHIEKPYIKKGEFFIHLEKWNQGNNDNGRTAGLDYRNLFEQFFIKTEERNRKRSHIEWKQFFLDIFAILKWQDCFELNSENYQALKKFSDALSQLSSLDIINNKVTFIDAFKALREILETEIFQVESILEESNRVNIFGLLEAASQDFDKVWICSMDNENWPNKAKPNPFISVALQREFRMPHADADREFDFSQRITDRFLAHNKEIIFSFSRYAGEQELELSPLIASIKNITMVEFENLFQAIKAIPLESQINALSRLESFQDSYKLPLENNEQLKGGYSILKEQAKCPFSAFIRFRLELKADEEDKTGIDARERGKILHDLMENIWEELRTQDSLRNKEENELGNLIKEKAGVIFRNLCNKSPEYEQEILIETQRASIIAKHLLELDKKRSPFEVISLEKDSNVDIYGIKVLMRLDRVDRLANDSSLIIDYKTGSTNLNSWVPPRIDDPQLPLYLGVNPDAVGIFYSELKLNQKETLYRGIASSEELTKEMGSLPRNEFFKQDWEQIKQQWQSDIETTARSFLDGNNHVDPKDRIKSCKYCDYTSICRIQEITGSNYDDE